MRKYHLIQYNKPDCCFTGTPRQPRVPACTDSFIAPRASANKLSHLTGDHAQRNVSREMKHTASGLVQASKIMRQNRPPPSPSAYVDSTQSGDAENARNAIVWIGTPSVAYVCPLPSYSVFVCWYVTWPWPRSFQEWFIIGRWFLLWTTYLPNLKSLSASPLRRYEKRCKR